MRLSSLTSSTVKSGMLPKGSSSLLRLLLGAVDTSRLAGRCGLMRTQRCVSLSKDMPATCSGMRCATFSGAKVATLSDFRVDVVATVRPVEESTVGLDLCVFSTVPWLALRMGA